MGDSIFRKIAKILEKPEEPAYMRERRQGVTIPWYRGVLDTLRPPSATGSARAGLTASQRRMLLMGGAVLLTLAGIWGVYDYMARAPQRALAAYDSGMNLLGPADFKGAVSKFSESLSIKETPAAYIERGNAYEALAQSDKALLDWNRAVAMDANSANAYAARGTHYRVAGKYAEAMADLNRSIEIVPNVDALYQRGQAYAALGKFDEALKDYNEAIELAREVPFLYLARASARRALGDPEGSLEDQAIALRLQSGQ